VHERPEQEEAGRAQRVGGPEDEAEQHDAEQRAEADRRAVTGREQDDQAPQQAARRGDELDVARGRRQVGLHDRAEAADHAADEEQRQRDAPLEERVVSVWETRSHPLTWSTVLKKA
jgi:hypothetical protein